MLNIYYFYHVIYCSTYLGISCLLQEFFLCLLAGCSICWFNTVCFVLCIRNFPSNRALALSLTVSFNGVSAALYTLIANSVDPSSSSIYLFLNAVVPLIVSFLALIPILRQPSLDPLPPDAVRLDSLIFLILNVLAVITGLYLLLIGTVSTDQGLARILLGGAVFLLAFPLLIPGIVYARSWFRQTIHSSFHLEASGFLLVDDDDLELHKELITREASIHENGLTHLITENGSSYGLTRRKHPDKEGNTKLGAPPFDGSKLYIHSRGFVCLRSYFQISFTHLSEKFDRSMFFRSEFRGHRVFLFLLGPQ